MSQPAARLVASCLLAAPALADSNGFAFHFSYDRAELASADGAARVHAQLKLAATDACQHQAPSAQRGVDSDCRDRLVDEAVRRNGDTRLAGGRLVPRFEAMHARAGQLSRFAPLVT